MHQRRWMILMTALFLLTGTVVQAEQAKQTVQLTDGTGSAAAEVILLDKTARGASLSLSVPTIDITQIEKDGSAFQLLEIAGGEMHGDTGAPALPVVSQLIAVPAGQTYQVEGITSDKIQLDGSYLPFPAQGFRDRDSDEFSWDQSFYTGNKAAAAQSVVQIGEPALLRGLRVVPVTFSPLSWDPATGKVEAIRELTVELTLTSSSDGNNPTRGDRPVPESFARMYEETVIGYERDTALGAAPGSWLIITENDNAVKTAIEPLVGWRQRQGYNVITADFSQTGSTNTSIKNYLQNQYNSLQIPLEFVTLVGDASGAVAVPSWREGLSGYNGEGDHEYTRLEGNDVLADVHLGRISVNSTAQLNTVIDKIVDYEMDPHMSNDIEWFRRAGLTGDPSSSGYSCIWVNQWVKQQLERLNYTRIDTIWGGNFVTQMMSTINAGETIFTYRGYWHMSGLTTGYIESLSNGQKLPYAVILTCDTGSFWSDDSCRSEAFLRAPNGGGIASVGTATTGTHTRYNNCMFQGLLEGVLNSGDQRTGPSLTRGKLNMYQNYNQVQPNQVEVWSTWNNLMGDPATMIYTGIPQQLTVDYPASVSIGTNALPVTVTSGGQPVVGARVVVYRKSVIRESAETDENGQVVLPLSNLTNGEILVTVIGNNLKPYLGGFNVGSVEYSVDYSDAMVDGDGFAAPGETVELSVELINNGTGGVSNVTGHLVSSNPLVSVGAADADFGYLASGGAAWGQTPYVVTLDPSVAGGTVVPLQLLAESGVDQWVSLVNLTVTGPGATMTDVVFGGAGAVIDPGETASVQITLENTGNQATGGISGLLTSDSQWITVSDPNANFGAAGVGETTFNPLDLFSFSVASDCYPGHLATFNLELTFAEGGTATVPVQVNIGTASSTDPVGPDMYGYYAFDNTDTSYDFAPTYEWIEIDPNYGGPGVSVGLTDYNEYQDDTQVVDLPFEFSYYGKGFDQISICSNGWVAMGVTYLRHYRNWTIPSPGGPDNMIAVFWDNLELPTSGGGVFTWYDEANHRLIIEWSRMKNNVGNQTETFQVMLYDPAYAAGDSGDGLILCQYHTVNQPDSTDAYSTVGIQNGPRDDGVLYTFWNQYPGGAANLTGGRAIMFRTVVAQIQGILKGSVTNATNNGSPVSGASISVVGTGRSLVTSEDGQYFGGVPIGTYDIAVYHPSFAPDTTYGVSIVEAQETTVDFALVDIAGPGFELTVMPGNSEDTVGPYGVEARITDETAIADMNFWYTSSSSGGPFSAALVATGAPDTYRAEIPGQALGSRIQYWLTGTDSAGNGSAAPIGAPYSPYSFAITEVSELYSTEMETAGDWTGGIAGDTASSGLWERVDPNGVFEGTTEIQPEDDHTPSGTMCWITGNDPAGSQQGTDDVDGGLTTLESPVFDIAGSGGLQVSYYRWYTNDTGNSPGQDYWKVQVSSGGSWVDLESTTGSNRSWLQQSFLLEEFVELGDQVQFRFLAEDAGSGSVVEAGVDDFTLLGYSLPGDAAAPTVGLTSFGGGGSYNNGIDQEITWNHSDDIGVVHVQILLSTDSGATFDQVVAEGPLNQTYLWDLPGITASTCRLQVICHDAAGNSTTTESAADFTITGISGIEDTPSNRLALSQNAPNPFNPKTEIRFSVPSKQEVSLRIYNVEGRLVRTLVTGAMDAGAHTVFWSGDDEQGGRVASGLYFYRLVTDTGTLTRKMTLLK